MSFFTPYSEHEIFTNNILKLAEKEFLPHLKEWEDSEFFPNSVFKTLGEAGYLGILIPEEYGGIDGDYTMAAAWCEAFGTLPDVGFTTAVNMHSLVVAHAIAKLGSPFLKETWLPPSCAGSKIGAYAFTEPGAGSDLSALQTKAVRTGDKWILNGSKIFITNGKRADYILVLAKTDPNAGYHGFTTFLLDTTTPGFKVQRTLDKLGWRSSDTAELTLENVEVPHENILGKEGEGWIQSSNNLNWERMMLTLLSLSGARECVKLSTTYAQQRMAFGKTLSEIVAIKDLLAQMRAKLLQCEAITYRALAKLDKQEDVRIDVALAKRQVCEDAVWIADKAIQIHGGYGYTKEFLPEKWWRELRLMPIGGGTSEIMANVVIKLLGWHKQQ